MLGEYTKVCSVRIGALITQQLGNTKPEAIAKLLNIFVATEVIRR